MSRAQGCAGETAALYLTYKPFARHAGLVPASSQILPALRAVLCILDTACTGMTVKL